MPKRVRKTKQLRPSYLPDTRSPASSSMFFASSTKAGRESSFRSYSKAPRGAIRKFKSLTSSGVEAVLLLSPQLRLFNTMSGKKERFRPFKAGAVSMFVCGPTVQSRIHMGHARSYVFYDVLAAYLRHLGYRVEFLMNITDQDERITQAAQAEGEDPVALADRYAGAFREDMASLGCLGITRFERVTSHVGAMISQVTALVEGGMAYVAGDWVYFDTSRFRRFGRLSHLSKEELSLRPLELSPRKKNLNDFALWRPEVLVEGRWQSPWGVGSPGWHVQDTAVTMQFLGDQYDIHGGAIELIYPHHEAQIAQAESLTGKRPFVKYWVHTRHLNMGGRKMSKSTGNVLTVRDALEKHSASELRLFLLGVHYRSEMDLSGLRRSSLRLKEMRRVAAAISDGLREDMELKPGSMAGFEEAMNDDLDTPRAISWVERTLERGARERTKDRRAEALAAAVAALKVLGVDLFEDTTKA